MRIRLAMLLVLTWGMGFWPVSGSTWAAAAHGRSAATDPVVSPAEVGMSARKLGQVRTTVQELIDNDRIAGATVLVARRGKIVLFESLGMMNRRLGKPMRPDTIFRIYSMTKPITSVAVMMLYEEGKVDLDAPVARYIPAFEGLRVYDGSGTGATPPRPMTVRDLLRHTSGLTYGVFGDTPVDRLYRKANILDRDSTLEEMVEKLADIPLLYPPGTRWHYSVSTDVLGYLVEVVSGQPLDHFFARRIFRPLWMKDTAFHVARGKLGRFAACYGPGAAGTLRVVDEPTTSEYRTKPALLSGGGGLVSTAMDYYRFAQMLLNKGELGGRRLLRPETVEMMTRNQLPEGVQRGPGEGFGLGFSVRTVAEGLSPKGEFGWGGMASTHFWISPRDELVVVALSQHIPYSNQLEKAVKPIIYGAILDRQEHADTVPSTPQARSKP